MKRRGTVPKWNATKRYWQANYTTPDGRKSVYSSIPGQAGKDDCQAKLDARLLELDLTGTIAPAAKPMSMAAWLDQWVTDWIADADHGDRTVQNYQSIIDNHLKPALGDVPVGSLQPIHVKRLLNGLEGRLSGTTRQHVHGVINGAMKQAVIEGLAPQGNPVAGVRRPRRDTLPVDPWTDDEAHQFLDSVVGHPLEAAYNIAVYMGLRESEVLGLRWKDIDFRNNRLTVNGQLGKLTRVHEPRKGNADPVVWDMPAHLVPLLVARQEAQRTEQFRARRKWAGNPEGFIFTTRTGRPVLQSNYWGRWQIVIRNAGVRYVNPHGTRHYLAAWAVEEGLSDREGAALLGHKGGDASTFARTYAHLRGNRPQDKMTDVVNARVRARKAAAS